MSIDRRLHRLEEVRGDSRSSLIIYEADAELSREHEAAFLKANVLDVSPNALIIGIQRLVITAPTPPHILQIGSAGLTHEEALEHLL